MEEKRSSPRAELDILINYSTSAALRTKNISTGGLCFYADTEFEASSYLTLIFTLPGQGEIKTHAKVIWNKKREDGLYETGVQFWHLGEFEKKVISRYIESLP